MPIMARQPNGEYIEICVIPSWIGGTQHDISEIKLSTDERIFKNWRTYEGTLPVTVEHSKAGFSVAYKIWGNTGGVGAKKTNLAEGEQLLRNASMGSTGKIVSTSSNFAFRLIPVVEGKTYSVVNIYDAETSESANFYAFFEELPQIGSVSYNERRYSFKTPSKTFVAPITGYLATSDYYPMHDEQHDNLIPLEVYEGNASPYYLSIVSASETTNVYIGREALEKGEYVDSESGKIYRIVDGALTPTDPPEPLPQIPTFAGTTAISYGGTGVQPEKVEFTYKLGV